MTFGQFWLCVIHLAHKLRGYLTTCLNAYRFGHTPHYGLIQMDLSLAPSPDSFELSTF
jgi:hypothetical protein